MTKAEEKALERFPEKWKSNKNATGSYDKNYQRRKSFFCGYEQAEKDLALTVDDIELIDQIMLDLSNAYATGNFDYELGSDEFYQETLKRFNEFKARKK